MRQRGKGHRLRSNDLRPSGVAYESAGLQEGWLDRPQGKMRYLVAGQGKPLVLCHGFIGSAENFESWVPVLAPHRQLIIPDLPGCGLSDPLSGPHFSRALATEVRLLLDHLGVGRYEVGGLCLGAAVALEMLAAQPERVERVILHTPLLAPEMVTKPFRLQVEALTALRLFPAISAVGRWRLVANLYRRMIVEGAGPVDQRAAEVNFENQLRASPRAAQEWLGEGIHLQFTRLLDGWDGALSVLAATEDRLLDVGMLQRYCLARPRTDLDLIPAAGHGWSPEFMARQLEILERMVAQ